MKTNPRHPLLTTARAAAVRLSDLRPHPRRPALPGAWLCVAALAVASLPAIAQDQGATNTPPAESAIAAPDIQHVAAPADAPMTTGTSTNGIDLNFQRAPIDLVLSHLSDAAGFIIQVDSSARLSGYVTIRGKNLTREEAVRLLDTELSKAGLGAVRNNRILRIMSKEAIVSGKSPVKVINKIDDLEDSEEVITAIIPIQFVEAGQLVSELSTFISASRISANQAGNSIIITDTQSNIRHLVELAKAIDTSAEDVTIAKPFHLDYADPNEVANLLTSLFQDQNGGFQSPFRTAGARGGGGGRGGRGGGGFGGGAGGFGGGFGGGFNPIAAMFGGGQTGNSQTDRIRQRKQIVAVADPRTSSVVVTGAKDLLDQIEQLIRQLDQPGKQTIMAVIPIKNGNANDILQSLQDTVGANSRSSSANRSQTDPFYWRLQQAQQSYNQNSLNMSRTSTGGQRGGGQ